MKYLVMAVLAFAFIGLVILPPLLKRRSAGSAAQSLIEGFLSGVRK